MKIILALGVFCLIGAAIPAIVFGIVNTGVIFMGAAGAAMVFAPKYWDKLMAFKLLRAVLPFALTAAFVYIIIVSAVMIKYAYFNKPPESGEIAVIVLGGGIRGDRPSLMLSRRLNAAHRYMTLNPGAYCIVTGGQGPDEIMPESVVMKNYLVAAGISQERVIVEDRSGNTRENLKFASELMPDTDTPVVVVTDGFHQLRANLYARKAGLKSYAISALTPWGLLPSYWVRELLGLAAAWILGK